MKLSEALYMKSSLFAFLLLGNLICHSIYSEKYKTPKPLISENIHANIEVLSWSPRIFIFRNFLSEYECDYMIAKSRPHLAPSMIVDSNRPNRNALDSRRKSESMFFAKAHNDPVLSEIEKRISLLTLIPMDNAEALQVVHYHVGGEYQPHYDYFDKNTVGGASQLNRGGQRIASFLMYLNNPEMGGCTIFPKVGIEVQPVKGDALLFFDCNVDGVEDPMTFHGGAPVLQGEKWLATKWLHPRYYK